ncbi:hypothetical protein [Egbenema bharatensis]|uniref:hypothetical protein n=1 Tax=Egbenema bharatensis TaxID=3463334 RepID=UPI003A895669
MRSGESGVGSEESEGRSGESGVGSRESGVGSRESGVGSRESGVGASQLCQLIAFRSAGILPAS